MEENKNENTMYCSHCGALIGEDEDYEEVNGEIVCTDCYERFTSTCDRCGETIWTDDSYGDEYTTLCRHCYENHYTRCSCCDTLLHEDDAYHLDGYDYCSECYHDEVDRNRSIHDYGYKPEPIFYGDSSRYFGVELEIDGAGKDSDNADSYTILHKLHYAFYYCWYPQLDSFNSIQVRDWVDYIISAVLQLSTCFDRKDFISSKHCRGKHK